ncbi:hypothetical protein AMK59_2771 [Oryctes borbonicus]|uniref:Reelin domain-containing protein n=1 Tax=Oryctes borbonicus TaxID=1629725 RepID=A0A0T6BAK2_9SCAR|nr:hypothetical protein AMK59_2771 [Oryctes borbonicus]
MSATVSVFCVLLTVALSLNVAVAQDFYWRDYYYGSIPCDAVEGALGRYIGQVNRYGDIVATIYPHNGTAITDIFGKQSFTSYIKIFCTNRPENLYWEKVDFNAPKAGQMKNVVRGGFQIDNDTQFNLYIGKALHENEWKIGKVVDITHRWKGLWLWSENGVSVSVQEFFLLKYRRSTTSCNAAAAYQ